MAPAAGVVHAGRTGRPELPTPLHQPVYLARSSDLCGSSSRVAGGRCRKYFCVRVSRIAKTCWHRVYPRRLLCLFVYPLSGRPHKLKLATTRRLYSVHFPKHCVWHGRRQAPTPSHHPFRKPLHKNASFLVLADGEVVPFWLQQVGYLLVVDLEIRRSDQKPHPRISGQQREWRIRTSSRAPAYGGTLLCAIPQKQATTTVNLRSR